MKVRRPLLDFSETSARWSAIPEFAQTMNASSLWIPHLERFLNRVLVRALSQLDENDPKTKCLRSDVRLFVRQEANHYALHDAFNTVLQADGYDVSAFERHFEAEFERLFSTRSLAFLCAYCEGFETLGPPSALVWLDEIEELLEGADAEVVKLWKWHLAEEYEHRNVCHDVFHAIHGGYFMRLYGFFFQLRHLGRFSALVRDYLLAHDQQEMSEAERLASRKRARRVRRTIARLTLPKLLRALSPFYSPRNAREPRMFRDYLGRIEAELA
jgi:predicted metal-dependent hydrolase